MGMYIIAIIAILILGAIYIKLCTLMEGIQYLQVIIKDTNKVTAQVPAGTDSNLPDDL